MDVGRWRPLRRIADRIVLPLAVFGIAYVGTMYVLVPRFPGWFQWTALISVTVATIAALLWERGRWDLGLVTSPPVAAGDTVLGIAFAVALIGTADLLILSTTAVRHGIEARFPIAETVAVFLP